ncbi:MAG: DUF2089 domain-containing protein [Bacillota bacterium]|jgi:hypothetical protein
MANEVIGKCPVCGDPLLVSELYCPGCQTKISGSFDLCKFCKLNSDQRAFAEVFIKNRGNIREVERELGISYPTVRSRLENLIRALGYTLGPDESEGASEDLKAKEKREILDKLAQGQITPQEAARMLRTVSNR